MTIPDRKEILAIIRKVIERNKIDSLNAQVSALDSVLDENGLINVALVGGFKSGKSSFINSVSGRDILPVAVLPLTSVITYVRYGPEEKITVKFQDGHFKAIPSQDLEDYITERLNPHNVKRVSRVDIELKELYPFREIQLVDTPGVGSAYKHNTQTLAEWLPKIGAAFVTVNITHPFSELDIALLQELKIYTSEIIVLLTKIDLTTEKEVDEVTAFVKSQFRKFVDKEPQIFPFSNRPGFETNRNFVFNYIIEKIASRHRQKSNEILDYKFRSIASQCREYLNLALSIADSATQSRNQLYEKLLFERELLPKIRIEMQVLEQDININIQKEFSETFQSEYGNVVTRVMQNFDKQAPLWHGNLAKQSEHFREWLRGQLTSELEALSERIGVKLAEKYVQSTLDSLKRIVEAFQNRLSYEVEKVMNTKFSGAKFDAHFEKPKQPDVRVGTIFMTPLWQMFWFLIPMRIFRPVVHRHFQRVIKWEIEKNLYRLGSQWTERLSPLNSILSEQAFGFIKNEIITLSSILQSAPDQRKQIEEAIEEIDSCYQLSAGQRI